MLCYCRVLTILHLFVCSLSESVENTWNTVAVFCFDGCHGWLSVHLVSKRNSRPNDKYLFIIFFNLYRAIVKVYGENYNQ